MRSLRSPQITATALSLMVQSLQVGGADRTVAGRMCLFITQQGTTPVCLHLPLSTEPLAPRGHNQVSNTLRSQHRAHSKCDLYVTVTSL